MRKIEALADAIVAYSGATEPLSDGYKARNPGMLRAFSGKQPQTDKKLRVFKSLLDGYQALLFDLQVKLDGRSHSKVGPDSSINDLLRSYCMIDGTGKYVAKFLRKALQDEQITDMTQLVYFKD